MSQKVKFAAFILLCGLMLGLSLPPLAAQTDTSPVVEDGSYRVGLRLMTLSDASRDNRKLQAYI